MRYLQYIFAVTSGSSSNIICSIKLVNVILFCGTLKLPQFNSANPATFSIQIRKFTAHICGNFWVTQYIQVHQTILPIAPSHCPSPLKSLLKSGSGSILTFFCFPETFMTFRCTTTQACITHKRLFYRQK